MNDRFTMKGRNAIVTGATRGIGLAIARGFLESGATVTLCGRKQEGVDVALADLSGNANAAHSDTDHSGSVLGLAAHVGQVEDIERLVAAAEERFGPVDTLVNNAGTNPYYGPIAESFAKRVRQLDPVRNQQWREGRRDLRHLQRGLGEARAREDPSQPISQ